MNTEDVLAQVQDEITWRRDELRFLSNLLLGLDVEGDRSRFRKALLVMLYAHLEGFCKAALTIYVRAVNLEGLSCAQLNDSLAAAALSDAFTDLHSPRKSAIFQRALPDDERLHRLARQVDFVGTFPRILSAPKAQIPEDVVDTESNLKPVVLRKNLFKLGLDTKLLEAYEGALNELLQRRNDIAHGAKTSGLQAPAFETLQKAVFELIDALATEIRLALERQSFRAAVGA